MFIPESRVFVLGLLEIIDFNAELARINFMPKFNSFQDIFFFFELVSHLKMNH